MKTPTLPRIGVLLPSPNEWVGYGVKLKRNGPNYTVCLVSSGGGLVRILADIVIHDENVKVDLINGEKTTCN